MGQGLQSTNDAKQVFRRCGTCSQAFGHIVDREFGHQFDVPEQALTRLAGGINNRGHQCGMLWGAALGVGTEAAHRQDDPALATGLAIEATRHVVNSFVAETNTTSCHTITGRNLDSVFGLVAFMVDTLRTGMDDSPCFQLAESWAPKAIQAAHEGLDRTRSFERSPKSCASQVVRHMGGSDDQALMVAGFAGGLGLSGEGCGALAAAIWKRGLDWAQAHPGEDPGLWADTSHKAVVRAFEAHTHGEYHCRYICGRNFNTVEEHAAYLDEGGCADLIEALSHA